MGWPLHLDLPHKRVASPARAEADGFEKVQRNGVGTRHKKPDAVESELLAAEIEDTQ